NAGTFLSSQPDSDATRNFITGMATAKANQEIQEWLGKYGTARVKLNVDKDFSLKDSSLEMLYPIYDTPTNMLFTQGAIHRTDDRTQSNIGFGWRHFSGNDWMAGVNTFIDHDLSRSHTRIGVGAEYWRDYLKLSANGYIRASGWKKSPDVEDYQERPANGWDIRAEGYLPAWPQLGASLMYEQYYGDEVGLFGKDKRQKDPHAISAEVTYTPVPLLTLSAGHKQGKSGENDTRFGLEVNYRIGEPLEKQLDTDSIRERRMLAGSRYDLVERNNNIVLEYRKSE
ncbi:inverse autotransporter beta domain-containing protein, partial [Escherichia coli]|nr:inverse autotransporter beta domain-containing protein [Escherichia coli]